MLASRCDWVFSCDLIFSPKFFGLSDTPLATIFALPMDHRTTNSFDNRASSSLARSRVIAVLFPLPKNVHGSVFFQENAYVAIVAAESKETVLLGGMDRDE